MPKKSVFTRAFGVFCFEILLGRCPAPKPGALSTALHPDILFCFFIFAVVRCASCCGTQNLLLAFAPQILTAATPFCSLLPPPAALANVPHCLHPDVLNYTKHTPKSQGGKMEKSVVGAVFYVLFYAFFSFFLPSLSFLPFLFVFLFVFFSAFICSVGSFDAMASPISSHLLTNRK